MSDMRNLVPLDNFDCEGSNVGLRWEKWKRGLQIYLEAAEINEPVKKRATLLHMGGLALQEVYYNLPGAHIESDEDADVYNVAVSKLNEYFAPKQSSIYERHLFRQLKQESGESFETYLIRLRKQATKCNFADKEESLIDQIVEKCSSAELKKKILKAGDAISLEDVIKEASILQSVNRQLDDFNDKNTSQPSTSINKIEVRKFDSFARKSCFKCGNKPHRYPNECPAWSVKCRKCEKVGHFQKVCRSASYKRNLPRSNNEPANKKPRHEFTKDLTKRNQTEPVSNIDNDDAEYVFHIDDDASIKCSIGGVETEVLIDSGSKCNLLTQKTWKQLKQSKVKVSNQVKSPEKTFLAYGSNQPLVVLGSFNSTIKIGDKEETATFYVIKDGTRDLLGRETATELRVLQIGLNVEVNAVESFPKFQDVLIEIPIDQTVQPVNQPYRRIPIPLETKVNQKLDELVNADIIEEVKEPSRWVSPIVPILKENGDVRICVDMRRANAAIVRENHPLPTMNQLLPNFKKAKYFSRLDIKDAFHQLEIHPDSRHITTFITSRGMYRYKRLMFGISCAPEIFQKTLERILLQCEGTVNFIDDIIVYGATEEEHDLRLKHTLEVLKENNILLNPKKCVYKIQNINFLGHELSPEGIKPLDKYLDTIQSFRTPSTKEELQSFLGLVNFVGKWIPNLATLTDPLRKLLRSKPGKNNSLNNCWTKEQEEAFGALKDCLSNIKTLGYYDPSDRTQVIADASPVGLGAILIQIDSSGPRVVAYGSRSLTDCEKRYCQTEKEALALVWAVEHFRIFLYGKQFELISDHKPLEMIFGQKSKPCARIERWVLRLQSYCYKVIYRPGKTNIADPLSRLCPEETSRVKTSNYINQIVNYSRPVAVPLTDIERLSAEDDEIVKIKKGLYQQDWDSSVNSYKIFQTELCFHNNILLRGSKIVIPGKLRQRVLDAAHEGHPGIVAMKTRLRTKVWWHQIDKDAEKVVRNCKSCTLVSAPNPPNPMKRRELPTEPWTDVAIDLLGPLPSGEHILVLVDYYSRYKELKITKNITSSEIIKILKEIFSRLGFPATVTADNGRQFTSEELKEYFSECGITMYHSIPYWPQQNGEVERQNRSILKRLRISQIEKRNWKEDLLYYLMMYNSTPHSTTGKTPSELFFRRQFRDKLPTIKDIENKGVDVDMEVRDKDKLEKEKGKEYSDRKRKATDHRIEEGDKVFVQSFTKENKLSSNFSDSPHIVTKASSGSGDVTVRNEETGHEFRRNVVHLKKIGGNWQVLNSNESDNQLNKELTASDSNPN